MADRTFEILGRDIVATVAREIRATVQLNDTLTFNDFDTVLAFAGFKLADGTTVVTSTISGNVVTITNVGFTSDTNIIATVTGVLKKAAIQ